MTYDEEKQQDKRINKYAEELESDNRYTYGVFIDEELPRLKHQFIGFCS